MRLFSGLQLLHYDLPAHFDWQFLKKEIKKLVEANSGEEAYRLRLMITRGEGGILEDPINSPQFLIECWPIERFTFNDLGLKTGIYSEFRKGMDKYSNIKSSNYLPSVMAMLYGKQKGWQECVFLNTEERICDATISNVFWIKGGKIFTTPLMEGGIAGVMRSFLLEELPNRAFSIEQQPCPVEDLMEADEVFFTNAIRGIRWVKSVNKSEFSCSLTEKIFTKLISGL